jgi:uncharacterized membrane protein YdjX (TVP38/TMEM64 family)
VRAYLLSGTAIAALLLALFGLAQASGAPVLSDDTPSLGHAGVGAALAGVGLLVADVVLPVPASGVMLANGALFGPVGGAALSVIGSLGATALGAWLGRRGHPVLARLAPTPQRARAEALIAARGAFAVVVTRPIPVLAETVAMLAGAAGMPPRRVLGAALVGSLPPAVAYAIAGAAADSGGVLVPAFLVVVVLSAAVWFVGNRRLD